MYVWLMCSAAATYMRACLVQYLMGSAGLKKQQQAQHAASVLSAHRLQYRMALCDKQMTAKESIA